MAEKYYRTPWWVTKKVPPHKVLEYLKDRGPMEEPWSEEAFRKFLVRKRSGSLKGQVANTLIACPNNCGNFLNFFRITTASFLVAKRGNENEETARLRYFALASGFSCNVCCATLFLKDFSHEMRSYILQMSRTNKEVEVSEKVETSPTDLSSYF